MKKILVGKSTMGPQKRPLPRRDRPLPLTLPRTGFGPHCRSVIRRPLMPGGPYRGDHALRCSGAGRTIPPPPSRSDPPLAQRHHPSGTPPADARPYRTSKGRFYRRLHGRGTRQQQAPVRQTPARYPRPPGGEKRAAGLLLARVTDSP
jgi:hypothetical protein